MSQSEIGRELKVEDLKPPQVIVIAPPGGGNLRVTMWVTEVTPDLVFCESGELNWTAISFRKPDGTMVDDRGRTVRMFEYLGQVE
jgi:hypothetical protein